MRKKLRHILILLAPWACLALLVAFAAGKVWEHSRAARVPAERETVEEALVKLEDGSLKKIALSMDKVPKSYKYEPWHHGKVEKFRYSTSTYGLYGRKEEKITKYAEVYLPYGYDRSKKYDTIYLMHGAGGSPERFVGSPLFPRQCRYIIDNLIALGQMRPAILVSLTYYPKKGMDREQDWDAEYTRFYDKELIRDVLPQVEAHYSTYQSRWHRTFAGFSMGSVTAYYRLCDSLAYFHTFLCMSGSLYWGPDARETGTMSDFGARYIMDAVKKQGYGKDDFFLYSCTGSEDFAREVVKAQVGDEEEHPEFFTFPQNAGEGQPCNVAFLMGEGEEHDSHATDRYLYNALPALSEIMAGAAEEKS